MLSSTVFGNTLVGTSYASQAQVQSPQSTQAPSPPRPICNPNSPALQSGSTGAKVTELQRALTQVGYGSLLGKSGVNGKFGPSTQNAVKKFQQDNRIPVDGKVGRITWGTLCSIVPNSFIIQLKTTNPELIGRLRQDLTAAGGSLAAIYNQFNMLNVRFERPLPNIEQFITSLRAHPAIQQVFTDRIGIANQQPPQVNSTGIDRIDADLSAARSGDKVGSVDADIAIIDSGVNRHPDLNVIQCWSFLIFTPIPICNDEIGHGTHVAGIAAAKDNNIGVVGTAPGAKIWALKIFGNTNNYWSSDLIKALNYVSRNANDIEVVNLSLGGAYFSWPETIALLVLATKGVVVVTSAGNDNLDAGNFSPARIPVAITVSAISDSDGKCGGSGASLSGIGGNHIFQPRSVNNPDDFIASYSNYGSVVDLAAPGSRIWSTDNKGSYTSLSGTSMAAPHVAGAAALYKSLHPTANPFQVDAFLKSTATKTPATGNPQVPCDGAGRGYFDDRYFRTGIVILTDKDKEPLLHMDGIR
ncbi:MAG TPA: S8 family serine peptidase [Nitrososphaeraceae archaeon]|nr:S8 family serine peptidase [Nitrososphaeraceae archaeon]